MNITRRHIRLVVAAVLTTMAIALALAGSLPFEGDRDSVGAAENDTITSPPADVHDNGRGKPDQGAYFGRVTAAYVGPAELVFDRHELLVGREARVAPGAAAQDPDDYVIRDVDEPPLVLPVSDAVIITRVMCDERACTEGHVRSYDEFTMSFGEHDSATGERYFLVVLEEGVVVRVDERYFA